MEHAKERLEVNLGLLEKALGTLEKALKEPLTDIVQDASIQRFGYVFELSWKRIQAAGAFVGSNCQSPREAIKLAYKLSWVKQPEAWLEAMAARNQTSHIYDPEVAKKVFNVTKAFPSLVRDLLISLEILPIKRYDYAACDHGRAGLFEGCRRGGLWGQRTIGAGLSGWAVKNI